MTLFNDGSDILLCTAGIVIHLEGPLNKTNLSLTL